MTGKHLESLLQGSYIRPIDYAFAQFIESHESTNSEVVVMLAAFLSTRLGEQNSCLDLTYLGQPFAEYYDFPDLEQIQQALTSAKTVTCIDNKQHTLDLKLPLVLEHNKLYLQRYWQYEKKLSEQIRTRCQTHNDICADDINGDLNQLFPDLEDGDIDWQKVAVGIAVRNKLTFITGGPGTGKTTTVTRLLALLKSIATRNNQRLHIQLVAPTGKASARLLDSIEQAKSRLPSHFQQDIPTQCSTIHRMLGTIPNSPFFRANHNNLLHLDVLVVDEASMIDLPLMSKLFDALPKACQIIILGDKDQLASVEAGSVLSDICGMSGRTNTMPAYSEAARGYISQLIGTALPVHTVTEPSVIEDNLIVLQKSHRFNAKSGIGMLAKSINQGDAKGSISLLKSSSYTDLIYKSEPNISELISALMPNLIAYFDAIEQQNVSEAFDLLSRQQVLCAQRAGIRGIDEINQAIEQALAARGLIDTDREFYPGRVMIMTQNDHRLQVYNGDIGIAMNDPDSPNLAKVWMLTGDNNVRGILPNRLPAHENVYAMTIHKSQGSEYDQVHLCLPPQHIGSNTPSVSRELLYTGLTRAKQQFTLYANDQTIEYAVSHQCQRNSGLAHRLK